MKKYLLIFLLACSAAWTAQAQIQTTFNIRAGGGAGTQLKMNRHGKDYEGMTGSVSILLQTIAVR